MTRRIAVVTAGLSQPSSTRLLADQLADATAAALGAAGEEVHVDVVELRDVAHALTDHLLTGFATGGLAEAIGDVARADGLIVVTPVFSASYSGLFKTFFDVLEPETLAGKPVLLAATAGTARHSLVIEHALRPLFAYLRAVTVPTGVFAATEDFGGDTQLAARVHRAAGELAALVAGAPVAASRRSTALPAADEEFGDVVPFEALLRGEGL
ncbi:FMN reductase [Nocardioides zeae]|uniref:FMN reductase n=2 Tax=Nocardioides zeae TaxID=1457234 RepID=A0ACC6IIS3_9ACTN|nr:CE1759 family FMN reductase [Nocardioides zeae]MDQ1104057.1 FMN reductase [Nocardioides zeae]MDR6176251.1 FMN reductase [Nocardioides zeae]MDR6210397.1 FMN reductase [Nocardioides zeae]